MFIGFAGDLVVGVWVGRDDNKSLGKITGGTAPARDLAAASWRRRWRSTAAAARRCRASSACRSAASPRRERKSPLPEDWSEGGEAIREIVDAVERADRRTLTSAKKK